MKQLTLSGSFIVREVKGKTSARGFSSLVVGSIISIHTEIKSQKSVRGRTGTSFFTVRMHGEPPIVKSKLQLQNNLASFEIEQFNPHE